jgi:hypothetical protein
VFWEYSLKIYLGIRRRDSKDWAMLAFLYVEIPQTRLLPAAGAGFWCESEHLLRDWDLGALSWELSSHLPTLGSTFQSCTPKKPPCVQPLNCICYKCTQLLFVCMISAHNYTIVWQSRPSGLQTSFLKELSALFHGDCIWLMGAVVWLRR